MLTCALISLRAGAPQDIAAVVALGNTEILVCNEVMSFGGQLLQNKISKNQHQFFIKTAGSSLLQHTSYKTKTISITVPLKKKKNFAIQI